MVLPARTEAWDTIGRVFDFRVGGREQLRGRWKSGMVTEFNATFFDIVPGARIVYVYEMRLDGRKISTSLATFEFKATGSGTHLIQTEQGAFLETVMTTPAAASTNGSNEILDNLSA